MPARNVVLTERQQAELVDIRAGITEGLQQAERGEFAEGTIDEVVSRAFARAQKSSGDHTTRLVDSYASPRRPLREA